MIRTSARWAASPEVVVASDLVRKQLARRGLLLTPLLLFLSRSGGLRSLSLFAVQGQQFVPVIHEWSVRTAASAVVSASALRQFVERAQAKPRKGPGPRSRRPCSVQRPRR